MKHFLQALKIEKRAEIAFQKTAPLGVAVLMLLLVVSFWTFLVEPSLSSIVFVVKKYSIAIWLTGTLFVVLFIFPGINIPRIDELDDPDDSDDE